MKCGFAVGIFQCSHLKSLLEILEVIDWDEMDSATYPPFVHLFNKSIATDSQKVGFQFDNKEMPGVACFLVNVRQLKEILRTAKIFQIPFG